MKQAYMSFIKKKKGLPVGSRRWMEARERERGERGTFTSLLSSNCKR
jgi:hypothetical protein